MHYPTLLLPIAGGICAPLIWIISCYIRGNWNNLSMVLVAWLFCMYVAWRDNMTPKKLFISSGKTPPAEHAYELIIKGRGVGDNFFTSDRELAFADLEDFKYVRGQRVSFEELLRTKPFLIEPYCLDDERKQVIFIETPLAFDSAMVGPFYFSTQRQIAKKLYSVPYEEFNRVCDSLGEMDFSRLILLYNTSRCGSTLVSKAMDSMAGVQSISEPDMFTSMTHMSLECKEDPERMKEISRLATSTARLYLFMRTKRYPDRPILALKFRFQVTQIAHVLHEALPGAKSMFLYRNAVDVVDSMGASFINGGIYRVLRWLKTDFFYIFLFSALTLHIYKVIPIYGYKGFPFKSFHHLGAISPFVLGWLSVMEKAFESMQKGHIQQAFRYEDVCEQKGALLAKLLEEAGFKPKINAREMEKVFKEDSQAGSGASSSRRKNGELSPSYSYLRKGDLDNTVSFIATHPIINHWDFILPGTLTVKC